MLQYLIILLIFYTIFFNNNYLFAQINNDCINYTGGIGDFEHYEPSMMSSFMTKNENYIRRTAGWYFRNPPNKNYELKFYLDNKEKYSGNASQFIKAIIPPNSTDTQPFFQYSIRYYNLSTETINYYPNGGDVIYGNFKVKFYNINNLRFRFRILYWSGTGSELTIYQFSTTSNFSNIWQTINFSATMPQINSSSTLTFRFNFETISSTVTTTYNIWLDDFNLYVLRNNECIKWPQKTNTSSLKIFDVYAYPYPEDFIHFYLKNDMHLGSHYRIALPIKYKFRDFKYLPYISLRTLHKYRYDFRYNNSTSSKWKPRFFGGEFNSYLDFFNDFNISTINTSTVMKLFPQSRYPEYILLDNSTSNMHKKGFEENYSYVLTHSHFESFSIDHHIKSLIKLEKKLHNNSYLSSDIVFFDNYNRSTGMHVSRNYPIFEQAVLAYNYFVKNIYNKIGLLYKHIGNLGYNPFMDEAYQDMRKNYISIKDKVFGYLDEGFLLFPRESLRPANYLEMHRVYKTAIENKDKDYILIIGAYRHPYCDNINYNTTTFMIGSFYLINNPNVYFALRPVGELSGYNAPQCYPSLFYINIGNPVNVNSIEELVISTSTNADGILYKRDYTKGLVYVNTSPSQIFNINISSSTVNFTSCRISDREERLNLNQNVTLSIQPLSSKILYDCQ
jgi:hypothetical protein